MASRANGLARSRARKPGVVKMPTPITLATTTHVAVKAPTVRVSAGGVLTSGVRLSIILLIPSSLGRGFILAETRCRPNCRDTAGTSFASVPGISCHAQVASGADSGPSTRFRMGRGEPKNGCDVTIDPWRFRAEETE